MMNLLKTSYLDFRARMIVVATPPKKSKVPKQVFVVKNVHIYNNKVSSVFIKSIAYKGPHGYMTCHDKEQITSHILKPKEYFAGMKFKILK